MSLASLFANKCLEYLLHDDVQQRPGRKTPPHPPWSSAAEKFHSLCNGCGACVAACPNKIVALSEDRLPVLDFSQGGCTFCGDCARSCPTGALQFEQEKEPWNIRARIADNCLLAERVLCRTCGDCCEQRAIVFPLADDGQLPKILSDQCSGCGACAGVCPADAIYFAANQKGE